MRHIAQRYRLPVVRNLLIDLLEHRNQFLNESTPFLIDHLTFSSHLLFPDAHQLQVGLLLHLQQGIPLLQGFVIAVQRIQVKVVIL